jgi:hypothetical protein
MYQNIELNKQTKKYNIYTWKNTTFVSMSGYKEVHYKFSYIR